MPARRAHAKHSAGRHPSPWRRVAERDWNDWQWQYRHRLRTPRQLQQAVDLSPDELAALADPGLLLPVGITPYFASLIDSTNPSCPIRRQCVPLSAETKTSPDEQEDPLAEDAHSPVPGLVHRYPDRALLYAAAHCPVYCRHCNRRRKVGRGVTAGAGRQLTRALDYLRRHPEVRDVLISGGDPFTLSDQRLAELLTRLRSISHLEILRIATRAPSTLPQRITPALASLLRAHHPLYVNTQFNHLAECTTEAGAALDRLATAGCVLGNQMVLLRGVNEDPIMVKRLNHWLLQHRCRPYYIFQCDPALGTSHFRTSIQSGLCILQALRGWTSGLAVPHYVVDLPGGGGKVPLLPEYLVRREGNRLVFRNYEGRLFCCEDSPR